MESSSTPTGAKSIEGIYSAFIDRQQDFSDVVYQKKKLVMNTLLGVEMRTLGRQLAELAAQDRYARELNRGQLIDALIEVTACLPIYRTYIRNMDLPPESLKYIEEAVALARKRAPHLTPGCIQFCQRGAAAAESAAHSGRPAGSTPCVRDALAAIYRTDRREGI